MRFIGMTRVRQIELRVRWAIVNIPIYTYQTCYYMCALLLSFFINHHWCKLFYITAVLIVVVTIK